MYRMRPIQLLESLLGVSIIMIGFPTAAAASIGGTVRLTNQANGLCLESNGAGSAYVQRCNGTNYQKWVVVGTGPLALKDQATGLCLDSNTAGSVYTVGCNGSGFQQWEVGSGGTVSLTDFATGLCLGGASGGVVTTSCNGSGFQRWVVQNV
jgi:Ricin-type beta-trefoil lectin domain